MTRTLACLAAVLCLAPAASAQTCRAQKQVFRMLEKSDINRDGDVTRIEFRDYRASEFPRLNRNQDNYISSADLPSLLEEKVIVDITREMIEEFDTDGDMKVSRREFDAGPTLAFNSIDRDGNGIATRYEIVAARSAAADCP
jgi:Ca2+-binding EF-hand superfamily protein